MAAGVGRGIVRAIGGLVNFDASQSKAGLLGAASALLPRYDHHGGLDHPIDADRWTPLTPQGEHYKLHDLRYRGLADGVSIMKADIDLLKGLWSVPEPFIFGQAYRLAASSAFIVKLPVNAIVPGWH